MADKAWKRAERRVAAILGGERVGNRGSAAPDVVAGGWLAVECKERRELPAWLTGAMEQSERNAPAGALATVDLHKLGGRHSDDLLIMRLGDFLRWFGGGLGADRGADRDGDRAEGHD